MSANDYIGRTNERRISVDSAATSAEYSRKFLVVKIRAGGGIWGHRSGDSSVESPMQADEHRLTQIFRETCVYLCSSVSYVLLIFDLTAKPFWNMIISEESGGAVPPR